MLVIYFQMPYNENGVINLKTAILIPCYNEELTIEKVIKDFKISSVK